MFQLDWYDGSEQIKEVPEIKSFDVNRIEAIQYSFWAEHCLECAPPKCFKSCAYYQKRVDGHCKRTEHGQEPIDLPSAIIGQGVFFKFRPWAKIETYIYDKYDFVNDYVDVYKKYKKRISRLTTLKPLNVKHVLNNVNYFFITRSKYRTQDSPKKTTVFLFELYSFFSTTFKMIIEAADVDWKVIARNSVDIHPGFNSYLLDYSTIAPEKSNVIRYYPENSLETELLIINCEFVVLKKVEKKPNEPAKQVKCVAWDLDNTLWKGILSETDDPNLLELRDGVKDLILNLDKRGVVQTIVSKNDYNLAWKQIERLGLDDYFLYPAINWGQKSNNLQKIAKELNINIDTFAVIDDSVFEREEIISHVPQIRVYDEKIIKGLLALPEFDLPVTEEAGHRREMYQTEARRKQIQASYDGGYLDFIKSCEMVIEIGKADETSPEDVYYRCYELVSRTNQLNISGHKYSKEDFAIHYKDPQKEHIYFNCRDKYGGYGIVGYVAFNVANAVVKIDELAVSCRVAQKHVEYTILSWIARNYAPDGEIKIMFIKTGKNTPMFNALTDIGFLDIGGEMSISCKKIADDDEIISIKLI